jgi:hypothetical protein
MLVICAGAALHHNTEDVALLGAALLLCGVVALHLLADLRSAPVGFPWPDGEQSGAVATGQGEPSSTH